MKYFRIFIVIILLIIAKTALAYFNPGTPTGFANDYAGMLSASEKQNLENKLSNFTKETSNEITVVTIETLGEDTIENFAVELFADWKIGQAKNDNGILVLIARDDRQMRIEVGYGLEGALTDAQSWYIIDNIMKPAFREENYYAGINEAVDKIIAATEGEYIPESTGPGAGARNWEGIFWFGFFIIMWLASILGRSKSWWVGGVIGGIIGVIFGLIKGFLYIGLISIAVLVPIGLLFDYIVSKNYAKHKAGGRIPWWIGGGRGRRGLGGFGGFGGGGSGGGGASGSW